MCYVKNWNLYFRIFNNPLGYRKDKIFLRVRYKSGKIKEFHATEGTFCRVHVHEMLKFGDIVAIQLVNPLGQPNRPDLWLRDSYIYTQYGIFSSYFSITAETIENMFKFLDGKKCLNWKEALNYGRISIYQLEKMK